jgi:hypothetical protein
MDMPKFYRGGSSLAPIQNDYRLNRQTGLLRATRGVSVRDEPIGLERFGGAYEIGPLPPNLQIVQIGDAHHFEIAPAVEMTLDEYELALRQVTMTPV